MQNYINMFRICIFILIFCIHSLTHCRILSITLTSKINQHIGFFFEMSADIFPKCWPIYWIFLEISADIFQNTISNEDGDVVAVRVWKRNVSQHFGNISRHLKHCFQTKQSIFHRFTCNNVTFLSYLLYPVITMQIYCSSLGVPYTLSPSMSTLFKPTQPFALRALAIFLCHTYTFI